MEMNKIRKVICVREKSAIAFAVVRDGNFYVSGEAGARKLVGGYRVRHGCHSRLPQ